MTSRRLLVAVLGLSGICGCSSSRQPVPTAAAPTSIDKPINAGNETSALTDDAAASRDAIVARTLKYAEEMEKAIEAKKQQSAATQPIAGVEPSAKGVTEPGKVKPKPEASKVDWSQILASSTADDEVPATKVSPAPAVTVVPVVQPAKDVVTPLAPEDSTANTRIALDGADTGPIMIPEGQEIGSGEPQVTAAKPQTFKTAEDIALSEQLAKRIKENPLDVAAHLDYQLHQFTLGQSVPQLTSLASLPTEDREVLAALMDGLSNFRTSVQNDNNALLSKKIRPLVELSDRLKAQAELAVPVIALCKRVEIFGVYEPIEPTTFPAGRETPVILYCEIANFSSQRPGGVRWETSLSHSATLYKENGVPVWSDKTTNVTDQSRNRRHDFFVVKLLKLPPTLSAGKYVLKVTVMDRQTNRMAEGSIALTIAGAEGMAKTE